MERSNHRRWTPTALLAFVALLAGGAAHADVIYLSRNSLVSINHCDQNGPCSISAQATTTGLEEFNQNLSDPGFGNASQHSILGPNRIMGNLSAGKTSLSDARSTMTVQFTLAIPTYFTSSGQGSAFFDGGSATAQLTGPAGVVRLISDQQSGGSTVLNFYNMTGLLNAGNYTLTLSAIASGFRFSPGSNVNFNIDFTPVPLPAAGILLLSALGGLGALKRATRRASPAV